MHVGPVDVDAASAVVARRKFLIGGVGVAATAGILGPLAMADSASSAGHRKFVHGVASGDPLPDGVVLWTRVTPEPDAVPGSGRGAPVTVTWEVSREADFAEIAADGQAMTDAATDHTVKVDVRVLEPDTPYFYRFRIGDHLSPVGRTRTAPAPGVEVEELRFGVVSCANWQAGYFSAYRHLAQADVDYVIHLGDYLYEYEPGFYGHGHDWTDIRRHDPPYEIVTLADYRRRHAQYKTDPDLQALHARVPFIATWDDHELADGWNDTGAFEHQPRFEGPWHKRRDAAKRAYDEWMPIRMSGTAAVGDGVRVYRRLGFGALADLSMVDLRSYRDERIRNPASPDIDNEDRSLTGAAQGQWLVDQLVGSTARWKLVGNPVMVAPMLMPRRPQVEQLAVLDSTDPMTWGEPRANTDTWDGYPADRRRLLERIDGVDDVVFLSGDVHTSWATEVPDADGAPVAVEFVCPSVTSNNVDDFMGTRPRTVSLAVEAAISDLNPHVRYVNLDDHGFCVLHLTPQAARMEWHAISDRTDPRASRRRLARRTVRAGAARIEPS